MQVTMIILLSLLAVLVVLLVFFLYMSAMNRLFREIFGRKEPVPRVDRSPVKIDQKTVFGRGKN